MEAATSTPSYVHFRSFVRSFASISLDVVVDDAVRVRRSEQFVEVVLDVVLHTDRQVPPWGEKEHVSSCFGFSFLF
jgi:hypothetical protein